MMSDLSIVSICRALPGPDDLSGGIFVLRRLAAMAKSASVTILQPIPYFPLIAPLRPWAKLPDHVAEDLRIRHSPMFYVPKFLKSLDGYWLYRSVMWQLTEIQKSQGLDLVDAHFGYPDGVGALLAARRLGVPCFVTLRGFEAEYIHQPIVGQQIRYLLRNADGCICVARFLKDLALEHGASPEKTTVVHNAIDGAQFYPGDRSAARRALGLPENVPIVISVGHLISRKRHHIMLSAFRELLDAHPKARLLIVGAESFEPDYPRRLRNQVKRLGIQDCIEFLGNVPSHRVADYLRAADLFALGTQREGCCNAVLEALACGLPVVTTPVGDNTWFVKDGENGFIVPVDDSVAMTHALSAALDRRDWDRERIAAELGVGNWDRVARDVLGFFSERMRK